MNKFDTVTVEEVGKGSDIRFGDYDKIVLEEDLCIANDTLYLENPEILIFLSRELEDDRSFIYLALNGYVSKGDILKIKQRKTWI